MKYALMTTCKQRVANYKNEIQEAIDSLACQVDKVFLTLSTDEFDEIPKFNNCTVVLMKENLYSFKKYIPLQVLEFDPEDIIVLADDDWKMNPDYVDRMIERMGDNDVASLGCGGVIGCFCIMKAKCIEKDFFRYWNKSLIDSRIDDVFLGNYLKHKGHKGSFAGPNTDTLVREHAKPLIPVSANNPDNTVYPRTFTWVANYKPWSFNESERQDKVQSV